MKREAKIEKLMKTPKYKKYGYETHKILSTCIEILIKEEFTDEEIKLLFKHSFIEQKVKNMDPDEKIDYILNCDYFWNFFDEKSDPEKFSTEAILKKYGKYSEKLVKEFDEKARKQLFENSFADI